MAVAYLISRYPAVSHSFIQREVLELRDAGVDVRTITIRRPPESDLLTDADRDEHARTASVLPASPLALLRAHGRALADPGAYLRTLVSAVRDAPPGLRHRLWGLFYFVEAVIVWNLCRRAGIRHIHVHFANVGADVALLACRLAQERGGVPSLTWSFTMHGSTEFFDVREHRLTEKVAAASFVACISDFARSQLMMFSPPDRWDRLRVIRCGVDVATFARRAPAADPARAGTFRVLYVGRLIAAKGPHLLLQAVRDLADRGIDARVTFVGAGPGREAVEEEARRLQLDGRATFTGAVGQDVIRAHYDEADAFCLPSFAEGVPVVLMEAMSMGVPVVATVVGGIPELIDDGTSGLLVPPGRADRLTEALERLAREPGLARRLADGGRAAVEDRYDLAPNVRELRELLEPLSRAAA